MPIFVLCSKEDFLWETSANRPDSNAPFQDVQKCAFITPTTHFSERKPIPIYGMERRWFKVQNGVCGYHTRFHIINLLRCTWASGDHLWPSLFNLLGSSDPCWPLLIRSHSSGESRAWPLHTSSHGSYDLCLTFVQRFIGFKWSMPGRWSQVYMLDDQSLGFSLGVMLALGYPSVSILNFITPNW